MDNARAKRGRETPLTATSALSPGKRLQPVKPRRADVRFPPNRRSERPLSVGLLGGMIRIGTAGWAIPKAVAEAFPAEGSGLQRYAARFGCAEINSTFHRAHRASTLERWAAEVPDGFRFSVKLSKAITHTQKLVGAGELLDAAVAEARLLRDRLGPLLVQLPPSLGFEKTVAEGFFAELRARFDGDVALEPRHASWFTAEADALLVAHRVARVAADPARVPESAFPGGWPGLVYVRLHGSPQMYRSPYAPEYLPALAERLRASTVEAWCIFDNTASGAAAGDALALQALLSA